MEKEQLIQIIREEISNLFQNEDILFLESDLEETWSKKYKKSINCSNPKGFSQKAHCAARRKRQRGEKTKSKSPFK